jgi:hypothetical protein
MDEERTTPTDAASAGPEEAAARDAAHWAKRVSRLRVSEVPEGAINLNVEGRQLAGPIQGFGQMWQKTYQVTLGSADVSPESVVTTWKERFSEFWPRGNRFYAPLTGLAPGEVALLNISMPGPARLSTGVMVLYSDEESFTLMTPEGHVFAGWITFSATRREGATVAQVQVLMRAGDPLYELGMPIIGHRQEDRFWQRTLIALASAHGETVTDVDTRTVCVDRKRQWSKAGNVWHNAFVRTTLYTLSAPIRWLRRRFGRAGIR